MYIMWMLTYRFTKENKRRTAPRTIIDWPMCEHLTFCNLINIRTSEKIDLRLALYWPVLALTDLKLICYHVIPTACTACNPPMLRYVYTHFFDRSCPPIVFFLSSSLLPFLHLNRIEFEMIFV